MDFITIQSYYLVLQSFRKTPFVDNIVQHRLAAFYRHSLICLICLVYDHIPELSSYPSQSLAFYTLKYKNKTIIYVSIFSSKKQISITLGVCQQLKALFEFEWVKKMSGKFNNHFNSFPFAEITVVQELLQQNKANPLTYSSKVLIMNKIAKLAQCINMYIYKQPNIQLQGSSLLNECISILYQSIVQIELPHPQKILQLLKIHQQCRDELFIDEEIQKFFEQLIAQGQNFQEKQDLAQSILHEYSKGFPIAQTNCLKCATQIYGFYDLKKYDEKHNFIIIDYHKINQQLLCKVQVALLNSGGGIVLITKKHSNDKIIEALDKKMLKQLIQTYETIKQINLENSAIQPSKYKIEEEFIKFRPLSQNNLSQYIFRISVFPELEKFTPFYHKVLFKCYFYDYIPELGGISMVLDQNLSSYLGKMRKRQNFQYNLPCKKQFHPDITSYLEISQQQNMECQKQIDYNRLISRLHELKCLIDKYPNLHVMISNNSQTPQLLKECFQEELGGFEIKPAIEFMGTLDRELKYTKGLYFIFHSLDKVEVLIESKISSNEGLQNISVQSIKNRIELHKSLTESCKHKFQRLIQKIPMKTPIVASKSKKFSSFYNQHIFKSVVIHCMEPNDKNNTVLTLFCYSFMYLHEFKPIMAKYFHK